MCSRVCKSVTQCSRVCFLGCVLTCPHACSPRYFFLGCVLTYVPLITGCVLCCVASALGHLRAARFWVSTGAYICLAYMSCLYALLVCPAYMLCYLRVLLVTCFAVFLFPGIMHACMSCLYVFLICPTYMYVLQSSTSQGSCTSPQRLQSSLRNALFRSTFSLSTRLGAGFRF